MKKLLFSLLFLVASLFAEVKYTDMFDAYEEAKIQNRTVLIMLAREGCPGCEHMQKVVFEDKEISNYINENYILVLLDVYNEYVPEELEYFATPTFYFLNADETIIKRVNGGEKKVEFLSTLKSVITQTKK